MQVEQDCEVWLLGAIFQQPERIHEALMNVSSDDFAMQDQRLTFAAMTDLANLGKPVDLLHVEQRLREMQMWDRVGWDALSRFTDGSPLPERVGDYAAMVRESSKRRSFAKLLELCTARIDSREPTDECIGTALEGIWRILANGAKDDAKSLRQVMPEVLERMHMERARTGQLVGITTGIHELDSITTGIRPAELWVIGALPGRGKTAVGLQIATAAAKQGTPSVIFSLEMTREQIVRRHLAANTSAGSSGVRDPKAIPAARWNDFLNDAGELSSIPLYVDDSATLNIRELGARARLYVKRLGIGLIVVDYLRLVEAPGRELRERVGNVANALRQIAKDEKIGVVALSQLRRPGDLNDRPTMIDLKESGDVEAHANTVCLLYQPMADDGQPTGEDEIIIGKQRSGPLGTVPVVFDKRTLTFVERTSWAGN